MEQPDETFTTIRTIQPDFGSVEVVFFYATADGTVANPFDKPKSFPGDKFLTLQLNLDEYPEEVSIELRLDSQKLWYRPYRYYTKHPMETITEEIPIPNDRGDYTLTIRDSRFDGIVSGVEKTNYTLSYYDLVLVRDVFEKHGVSTNDFTFDPSFYDTDSPTAAPTTLQPTSSPTFPATQSPTEDEDGPFTASPTSTPSFGVGFVTTCTFVSGLAVTVVLSSW